MPLSPAWMLLAGGMAADPDGALRAPLDALLSHAPPGIVGAGTYAPCARPGIALDDIRSLVQRAERHVAFVEHARALELLERAWRLLPCLAEPLDRRVAARIQVLRAEVLRREARLDAARAALRAGLLLEPDLAWDPDFPPDGAALVEAARAELAGRATTLLRPAPDPLPAPAWIDGRSFRGPTRLPAGAHLVQWDDGAFHGGWLHLEPGEAVLVLPGQFPAEAASWLDDPARAPSLAAAVALLAGPAGDASLSWRGRSWYVGTGGTWAPRPVHPRPGALVALVGGVVGLAAGSAAAVGWWQVQTALGDMEEAAERDDWSAWQMAEGRYEAGADLLRPARWVALGGALALGAGFAWDRVALRASPAGATLEVRR